MAKKKSTQGQKKAEAFIASFFTIIGFIIALLAWKKDDYVMFYAKQGLVLGLFYIVISILVPVFPGFLNALLWLGLAILWVITWIGALSGEKKETFIVGDLAKKISL